jgi:iron(II)-dependent oxidoreductase
MSELKTTPDAYLGLEAPSDDEWEAWHAAMLRERADDYHDAETDWSDATFRQLFLFMYDESFYDRAHGRYRTNELIDRWMSMFGRVDSVLLWHAYPRLGFDRRTQFDFYRDMPGGIARLRQQVTDAFHAHGVRVFLDYNPWAEGSYEELAELVRDLDADGVMLDTMTDAPDRLEDAVGRAKRGVVFAPELRPRIADLGRLRQSWAQWIDIGEGPSILRHRWLRPRHRQFLIRRWDVSRKEDIVYGFFNGAGLLLWDNIFGSWNPYPREDRRLIAETAAILDRYQDLFVHGDWRPLIPTGVAGLDANRWQLPGSRAIVTLRNRTTEPLQYRVPRDAPLGRAYFAFWGDSRELAGGDAVEVEPRGIQALVLDDPREAKRALDHFQLLSRRADVELPVYDTRRPWPRRLQPVSPTGGTADAAMREIPAGEFRMTIRHQRRECGCYPEGATDNAMWGWFYQDVIEHTVDVSMKPFSMRATAVTNNEFLIFVHAAGYVPDDGEHFLKHIARLPDGSLPRALSGDEAGYPVTFVSLNDARAFAAWSGQRLPTEAEWQWAAEGAGRGNAYPWGNEPRTFPPRIRAALDEETVTPEGVMGLSGNTWELTESEHSDDHTRFVVLRGGVFLPPGESEWLIARGARPNDHHAKYLLLSDGLDRSETISFRTVHSSRIRRTRRAIG